MQGIKYRLNNVSHFRNLQILVDTDISHTYVRKYVRCSENVRYANRHFNFRTLQP